MLSSLYATFGRVFAYLTTFGTFTTPPMLMPQWQTKTPIRGSSSPIDYTLSKTSATLPQPLFLSHSGCRCASLHYRVWNIACFWSQTVPANEDSWDSGVHWIGENVCRLEKSVVVNLRA